MWPMSGRSSRTTTWPRPCAGPTTSPAVSTPSIVVDLQAQSSLSGTAFGGVPVPSRLEVIVGPTVVPGQTACYLCYRMRAVAR
jgi:hypothetical protein